MKIKLTSKDRVFIRFCNGVIALLLASVSAGSVAAIGSSNAGDDASSNDKRSSLPLIELVEEVLNSHPSIKGQIASQSAMAQGVNSAKWQYFPTPTLKLESVDASENDPSFSGDDSVATIGLSQPLITGGRLKSGVERARARVDRSIASLEGLKEELVLELVKVYVGWLSSSMQREAWAKSQVVHQNLRDQVERRFEQGASSKSDLLLAQGRLDLVSAEMSSVVAQEQAALANLSQFVGRPLFDVFPLMDVRSDVDGYGVSKLLDMAEGYSPLIRRAQADILIADAQLKESKSGFWPELSLRLEHQHGNFNSQNAGGESRIYLTLTSQLGAGLSNLSDVRLARYERDAALAEVEVQRRRIRERIVSDAAILGSLKQQVAAIKYSLDAARNVYDSYGRQYLAGRKTWLDLMNSAREIASTEVRLANALATQFTITWRQVLMTKGVDSLFEPQSGEDYVK